MESQIYGQIGRKTSKVWCSQGRVRHNLTLGLRRIIPLKFPNCRNIYIWFLGARGTPTRATSDRNTCKSSHLARGASSPGSTSRPRAHVGVGVDRLGALGGVFGDVTLEGDVSLTAPSTCSQPFSLCLLVHAASQYACRSSATRDAPGDGKCCSSSRTPGCQGF